MQAAVVEWLAGGEGPPFPLAVGAWEAGGWVIAATLGGALGYAATRATAGRRQDVLPPAAESPERARLDRRLAEVNRMTGGLAHEIKNPLSTIGLNVQLLREDLGEISAGLGQSERDALRRVQRRLDGVHRETARLRDILDDFLRFAGRIRLDLGPTDLTATVEELADFFTPEAASRGVRLRLDLAAGAAPIRADAGLLKQALLNLLMNAVQAMASGAPGDAGTGQGPRGELLVRSRPDPAAAERVLVEVIDTGPGIPADQREKIFEPYHTGRRGGSGLGLPTSRRIVELHGGSLEVASEVGRGSVFTLTLPRGGPAEPDQGESL